MELVFVSGDQSSGKGSGPGSGQLKSTSSPLHVDPAVVVGSKAVEAAYQEGKFPVVDKTVDVYALQSSSGSVVVVVVVVVIEYMSGCCCEVVIHLYFVSFLNQVCTHSWLKAGCGRLPGLLKYEKEEQL